MLEKCVRQKFFSFSSKFRLPSKCFQISFKTISHAGSMPCIILWFASRPDTIEIKRVFFSFLYSLTAPPYFFTSGYPRAQKLFFFSPTPGLNARLIGPDQTRGQRNPFYHRFLLLFFPLQTMHVRDLFFPLFQMEKGLFSKRAIPHSEFGAPF